MQVILTQNVPHVGALGDQVHVKDGFARNYLIPRGLAIAADSRNAREIQHRRRRLERLRQEAVTAAQAESERVRGMQIVIKAKAGAGGKLFGSVTSRDLQAAFAEQGLNLDRKAFILHAPVKNTGSFTATVRLHTDVKVDVAFKVESMDLTPEEKAALEAAEAEAAAAKEAAKEGNKAEAAPAEGAAAEGATTGEAKPAKKAKPKTDAASTADDQPAKADKKVKAEEGEKRKGKQKDE